MDPEKGKPWWGQMIERGSLQRSRGSLAAQLFRPSGREHFGRRAVSRELNTVRNPYSCQSLPISVLWGSDRRDGSRNRRQRSQVTETGTFPNGGTWGRGLGQTASQTAEGGLGKQNKPFHPKVTILFSHNSRTCCYAGKNCRKQEASFQTIMLWPTGLPAH